MMTTLHHLKNGEQARVRDIAGGHALRQRLCQCGLHPGDSVKVLRSGFFGGPTLIAINGCEMAIGQGMAKKIKVEVQGP
jgi:ferrous iron transport protein A